MLKPALSAIGDIRRLKQIFAVFARHGWGGFVRRISPGGLPWSGRDIGNVAVRKAALPQHFRAACEELGPAFVKLGQILATRADIFPTEWTEAFEALQNSAAPMPFEEVRRLLREGLGREPETVFSHIDPEPAGSASIAQVHRAVLHDGSVVAVKIKRPDIESVIRADLRILTHLAQVIESEIGESRRYRPVQMVQYFARSLAAETDLTVEKRALQRFGRLYAGHVFLKIPKVYAEYGGRGILVQEYMDGQLLADFQVASLDAAERRLLAGRLTDVLLDMMLGHGVFHADPHPGNIFIYPDLSVGLIDFGLTGYLNAERRREILMLLEAVIEGDAAAVRYVLGSWAEDGGAEDRLGADVMQMLADYEHTPLREFHISQLIRDITRIMREHELSLPPDLILLFKSLMTLEGVVKQIDGDFRLIEHAKPAVQKILARHLSPQRVLQQAGRQGRTLLRVLEDFPEQVFRLRRLLAQGRIKVDIDLKRLAELNQHLDRTANRLTMGVVTAALIIGSSIVLSANVGPKLFGLSFIGFAGYLLAFANSLWIIWSIWRSGRH